MGRSLLVQNVSPAPTVNSSDSAEKSADALARLLVLLTEPGVRQELQVTTNGATRGRKPGPFNSMSLPQRYVMEKRTGVRRENGAMKLSRLTSRHYKIIALHLEGRSLEDICVLCHISINTASRVLNDPLAKTLLAKVYNHRENEIHALAGKAIAVTRDVLLGDYDIGTKLRGVDRFVKIREVMIDKEQGRESAEDVVARILQNAQINGDVNIQVNQGK